MLARVARHALAVTVAAALTVACTAADPLGGYAPKPKGSSKTQTKSGCRGAGVSEDADASGMKSCTGTKKVKGLCVPSGMMGKNAGTFEKGDCEAGSECVPPEVVEAKDVPKDLKSCKVLGGEGRCFWALAKDILANYDTLQRATGSQCDDGMVCAPCVSPLDGKATGICPGMENVACGETSDADATDVPEGTPPSEVACPYKGTPVDTSKMPVDSCPSGMVCLSEDLVPENLRRQLPTCSKGLCAPKKSVAAMGNYLPPTCESVNKAEGRCLNVGLTEVAKQKSSLPTATCDADERCVPCFDPITGTATGACNTVSCDQPKSAPTKFATCCGSAGTCVPKASLPADQQSSDSLEKLDCKGATDRCVPTVFVNDPSFTPPSCTGRFPLLGKYTGVCLSECLDMGMFEDVLDQANCGENQKCAPCNDPLTDEPTGAPGCK